MLATDEPILAQNKEEEENGCTFGFREKRDHHKILRIDLQEIL